MDAGGGAAGALDAGDGQAGTPDASVDAGQGGSAVEPPDSGMDVDADAGPIVLPIPVCSHTTTWAAGTAIAELASEASQELLAVTPDERSIVWVETGADHQVKTYIADRDDATAGFGAPKQLSQVEGFDFARGTTITADGLSLIIVSNAGDRLTSAHRDDRTGVFSDIADETAFVGLNTTAHYSGGHFANPELSADGNSLYFTDYTDNPVGDASVMGSFKVRVTKLVNALWDSTTPILLSATMGDRVVTTGISSDALTLFYWDDGAQKEYATWRDLTRRSFKTPVELGDYKSASPNQACTRLYFTRNGVLFATDVQ